MCLELLALVDQGHDALVDAEDAQILGRDFVFHVDQGIADAVDVIFRHDGSGSAKRWAIVPSPVVDGASRSPSNRL